MMMDCEIFSIIHKMMQGIVVDDETLALEAIAAVGPGGNFLTQKHTRQHMRELFLPQFMDRRPYDEWEASKDDARDWALAKAAQILADPPARTARSAELSSPELERDSHLVDYYRMRSFEDAMQPKLELLTRRNLIDRILDEAFQLMLKPGIKVQSAEARELLAMPAAQVDDE